MDYSLPGSSVHAVSQEKILEWIAISFSRGSSRLRDQTHLSQVSCTGRQVLYHWCHLGSPKKAEHQTTDAFKLWHWRRLLRVPWTSRRSNQSILNEISPEYSLEGLMLKLQYCGRLMQRADSLKKIPMLGKIAGRRTRG